MEVTAVSVRQLNLYVKSLLDSDVKLAAITVCGEISNFKNHFTSGHAYFALKDEAATIRCVMFKGSFSRLRFLPSDGQAVLCSGHISLYERDGQYQFYVDYMMPYGEGELAADFEQTKARLLKDGLLDEERKRSLPRFPKQIAVLTSSSGAAIHDITSVLARRYPICNVLTVSVNVQGEKAVDDMISALKKLYANDQIDLLIIGRGGGSSYDLWAFNDERLARTLCISPFPVISAVGHESDYSICDLVADVRAATPSVAAELAVPERKELLNQIAALKRLLASCLNSKLNDNISAFNAVKGSSVFLKTQQIIIDNRANTAAMLHERLIDAFSDYIENLARRVNNQVIKLDSISPLKVLMRGYSIAQRKDGSIIRKIGSVDINEQISVTLNNGVLNCKVISKEEKCSGKNS